MKILLSTHALSRLPLREVFAVSKELGFDGVELVLSWRTLLLGVGRTKKLSEEFGVPILSVHQPIWHFPHTTKFMLRRLAAEARELGASHVVVHASVFRIHPKQSLFALVKQLERDYELTIGLENGHVRYPEFPPRWTWYEPLLRSWIDAHRFNVTLDVAKFEMGGGDPIGFFKAYHSYIPLVHLHGRRGRRIHLSLTDSRELIVPFLKALRDHAYGGMITLEVFPVRSRAGAAVSRHAFRTYTLAALRDEVEFTRSILGRSS